MIELDGILALAAQAVAMASAFRPGSLEYQCWNMVAGWLLIKPLDEVIQAVRHITAVEVFSPHGQYDRMMAWEFIFDTLEDWQHGGTAG